MQEFDEKICKCTKKVTFTILMSLYLKYCYSKYYNIKCCSLII